MNALASNDGTTLALRKTQVPPSILARHMAIPLRKHTGRVSKQEEGGGSDCEPVRWLWIHKPGARGTLHPTRNGALCDTRWREMPGNSAQGCARDSSGRGRRKIGATRLR